MTFKRAAMLAAALLLGGLGMKPAQADDFYKGKILHLVVGAPAGAGYDINARVLMQFLPNHIPGHPSVVVQNQGGAGSIIAANSLYNNGTFDGLTMGASLGGIVTAQLLQPTGVRFDVRKFIWLGTTTQDVQVNYVWAASPVKNFQDLLHTQLLVGAQGPGATQWDFPTIANAILGTKYKVVSGYESTPQIHTAMERGEVAGNGSSSYTTLATLSPQWLAEKKVNLILVWGNVTLPQLQGIPRAVDMAKNDADREALELAQARLTFGKPFFLPPGVPADRVAILRKAFEDTMKDPAFLAEEAKSRLDVIHPLNGQEMTDALNKVYATPQPVIDRVRKILAGK